LCNVHPSASALKLRLKPDLWSGPVLTFLRKHTESSIPWRETIIRQYYRKLWEQTEATRTVPPPRTLTWYEKIADMWGLISPPPPETSYPQLHETTPTFHLRNCTSLTGDQFISHFEETLQYYNVANPKPMILNFLTSFVGADVSKITAIPLQNFDSQVVQLFAPFLDTYWVQDNFILLYEDSMVFLMVNDD
jgi:hypothetical protein